MNKTINLMLLFILCLEFCLKFLYTSNYFSIGISCFILMGLFLFAKYFKKTQMKLPWFYLGGLIFSLNFVVLENKFIHYLLNFLITYHAIILTMNWAESESFVVKKNTRSSIDIGINRYSICFISVLVSVYLAMTGSSDLVKPIVFDCLGFLLLGCNLFLLMVSYIVTRFKNPQRSISLVFSSTIIAVLILLISGPYVISTLTPNLLKMPIQNARTNNSENSSKNNNQRNNQGNRQQEAGYTNDVTLSKRTDISKNHMPDAFLILDSEDDKVFLKPGKIYLRGAAFDTFSSNTWSNYYDNSQWFEDGIDNQADGVIRLQETPKKLHAIKHTVFLLNGEHGNILALPNISEIYMDKILAEDNDTYYLPNQTGHQVSYKLTSAYTTYEDIDKKNLVFGKKSKKYLSLMGNVSAKIKATTESLFKPDIEDTEKIESILYYFRQNFRYSLVTKNDEDIDPLENFFYNEKAGHCELFATALVMMLRSAGIPSRLCAGYCGGELNKNLNAYVFYTDEAHAWVEVYIEGYGWVVMDSTPQAAHGSSVDENSADANIAFNPNSFFEVGPNTEKINKSKLSKGLFGILEVLFTSASKDPMLLINLILLTYPISFFFILGILKILRYERSKQNNEILSSLDFIKEIYKKFGHKPKGQTFLEYLDKLKENKSVKDELDEIMVYYYSINYGKTSRSTEFENKIIIELSKLKNEKQIAKS